MIHLCIGAYATKTEPSVHFCTYADDTWRVTHTLDGLTNPTFFDNTHDTLFFLTVCDNGHGGIARYTIGRNPFSCVWRDTTAIAPATLCHVAVDAARKRVFGSSYHGGVIGVASWDQDGTLRASAVWHGGDARSKLHMFAPFPTGRYALACDFGIDRITTYDLDTDTVVHTTHCAPRSGPRHATYHPVFPIVYVVHECASTVSAYTYDDTGALHLLQTISTLPPSYIQDNACAEIAVSPDGRDVYASNRGHDSLAHYRVLSDGTLSFVSCTPTYGRHPRHFSIHPDGQTLFVAHRDTNDVRAFARDTTTGTLSARAAISIPKPVCVRTMFT